MDVRGEHNEPLFSTHTDTHIQSPFVSTTACSKNGTITEIGISGLEGHRLDCANITSPLKRRAFLRSIKAQVKFPDGLGLLLLGGVFGVQYFSHTQAMAMHCWFSRCGWMRVNQLVMARLLL